MISRTTKRFRKSFDVLPQEIKLLAGKNYNLWKQNSSHRSLKYKRISIHKEIYSIRIGKGYRALGMKNDDLMIWFWIGSHSEYDKLIKNL